MLRQIIKKDLLLFWRRPRELILLLLMPFILISILGTALSSINDGKTPEINIKLAIVQKDDAEEGISAVIEKLDKMGLAEERKSAAIEGMNQFNPIQILLNDVLNSEELKDSIKVEIYENEMSSKEEQKYSGTLEIPENFSAQFYQHAFLGSNNAPQLLLKLNESSPLEASVLKDILASFQEELTLWSAVHSIGINGEELQKKISQEIEDIRKIESVSKKNTINNVSYYAIGMSVMFIFYVASKVATFSYEQKESGIFGRLLLANVPAHIFFSGIFISTFILAFIQMNILYGLSAIFYDVTWPNLLNYFVITILMCIMISGFAVFLSSICYRVNSDHASQLFSNFLVPVLAFLGGSYIPVSQLGASFENISKFSPGGAGTSAYFKAMQGYSLEDILTQMITILAITVILVICAVFIQPKRGESV
ncbi:ABC transporter permease [Bacillus sp. 31A1R]|uniref:ABC transporter permease n=1 Tax=Robertmurraya mangrovi TaxID=3098077 RepID=A0ABU5IT07_9BACI|nr:ABC transporter permease [Bacillus sp. 31A1R]MDZ5470285.1 ABC transporter permease [Bacillus sp. 31A1R]